MWHKFTQVAQVPLMYAIHRIAGVDEVIVCICLLCIASRNLIASFLTTENWRELAIMNVVNLVRCIK